MINRNDITELLCSLVRIRSVTHDHAKCAEVLEFCKNRLSHLPSLEFFEEECSGHPSLVIGYRGEGQFEYDIVLNAHLDVVDAPIEMFEPRTEDEFIKGRGAFDMKSSAAAILCAFEKHVRSKSPVSVAVMLTTDEEIGGACGVKYLLEKRGYRAKCAVVPDGGGPEFALITSQKGGMLVEIQRKGISAHASKPEKGVNAITSFMQDFYRVERELKKVPDTTISLASIAGSGPAPNAVPDQCEAKIDFRSPEPNKAFAIVESIFKKEELRVILSVATCVTDVNNDFTRMFVNAAEEVSQKELPHNKETGGSDARYFSEIGIPVIVCSNTGGGLHADNEWVDVTSVTHLANTLVSFLNKTEAYFLEQQLKQST